MLVPISKSLQSALEKLSKETGEPISQLVSDTLSRCLGIPLHTLFQVSTSGALVQGVYEGAVSSNLLLNYGDLGLEPSRTLMAKWSYSMELSIRYGVTAKSQRSRRTFELPSL